MARKTPKKPTVIETIDLSTGVHTHQGTRRNDVIDGDDQSNEIYGCAGNDRLNGGISTDDIFGGRGNDRLFGDAGIDVLSGEDGNDRISGGDDADTIHGGKGNDRLSGDDGDDDLFGDAGNDWIDGGDGLDSITGGRGNDFLTGGSEADTFVFAEVDGKSWGKDTIRDFQVGIDKIDLTALGLERGDAELAELVADIVYDEGKAIIETDAGKIHIKGLAEADKIQMTDFAGL